MFYKVGFISSEGNIEIRYDNIPCIEEANLLAQRIMWCNRRIDTVSPIPVARPQGDCSQGNSYHRRSSKSA